MKLLDVVREVRRHLEESGRVSLRMLRRQYELDDEALDELIEELVDVQRIARREENVLVWAAPSPPSTVVQASGPDRPTEQAETRKVISVIFVDLMGSTALQERLDPESVNRVMDAYYQAVRGPVEAAGGTVVQLLGDGVLCAFGIPRIAEDDALRAVRAAVGIQQAFRDFLGKQQWLRVPIGLRVAVNTGEVVVSEEHPAGIGDPLNVAARLQQEARDGEVVIGQATRRLVADAVTLEQAGVFALKGRAETVTAYRVVSLERPKGVLTAAFVGRNDELARITAVYEAARATPAARLAVVVGSPGLGKSRLIREVARRLGDATSVVTAQCDAAGSATFAPVAEALREWLSDRSDRTDPTDRSDPSGLRSAISAALPTDAPDRDRIIAGITALLAGSPASPEETFFVIRRLLTALAQNTPVVLVIDDLHWAEPLLLDLVEHLIQWGSGVPLFVLVGARPELRELRSSLVTPGGLVADVVTLSGLDAGAAMRLAANVIGASDLPAAVAAKVLATSEGNPLFVGELVRMLVDEGAIERQGERWVVGANLAALEMPPTIHALLAARIERLRPDDRTVLERAAVVGRHFSRGAVAALLSRSGTELDAHLEALRRTELIEPDTGWFLGEPVLRFHHVLIRDAAYRRLLKGTRAELHERLADWIEKQVGDVAEHDETIGWHLEQAHVFLRELGPLDENGKRLGERAAARLSVAGRRALGRDDVPVAASLLGRAIHLLQVDDPVRANLALDWCEALLSAGDVGPAANAIAELARFTGANDRTDRSDPSDRSGARLRAWHTCFVSQLTVLTAPQDLQAAADAVAEAARQLTAESDAAGEAKAHSVHAQALARLGKVGAAEAALDQALAAARKAGDRRRANAVLAGAPLAALWGPSTVTRASGRCLDVVRVLRITQGAPAVESVALSCQGVLEALRGRTEAARRMLASARRMVEELGIANRLFEVDAFAGRIAAMEGDDVAAERLLRGAYEGLRDLGLGIDAARAGTLLARTLLAQDRVAEAEALSHESEQLAGDDLQAAIAWRGVRAEALAKRGEHGAAIELAKAAVAIASGTDALLDHADARVALAAALRAAGRGAEAGAEERRAIELWETKGAALLAERARQTPQPPSAPPPSLPRPTRRVEEPTERTHDRVLPNRASRMIPIVDAAFASRDMETLDATLTADHEEFDHRTGATWDRRGVLASFRRIMRSRDPEFRNLQLATLGDSLALIRRWVSAAGTAGGRFDVGEYASEAICVLETDERGRLRRQEAFAPDHLGDAIVRLYTRYAELLPDGPERARAAVTARALAYSLTDSDTPDESLLFSPTYEDVDHRSVGYGTLSTDEARKLVVSQRALADDLRFRIEDVLALRPDGLVRRTTTSGTWRDGGGAFERTVCMLSVFGPDGRVLRQETFDSDREAEALARFDTLVTGRLAGEAPAEPRPVPRRVRPNAATAMTARIDAALAARDFAAIAANFHESFEEVDHPTGSGYGREAAVASLERLFRSRDPHFELEPLATLGELIFLARRRVRAEGTSGGRYDVGAYENEVIELIEVDERGLFRRAEIFAADHLGEAIARLYERYAELLPEGPERQRLAATARSVAVFCGSTDPERLASILAPSFQARDRRNFGTWSGRDPEEWLVHWRGQHDLAASFATRADDVLALRPGAALVRQTYRGRDCTSGGSFENVILGLWVCGADGLVAWVEAFEPERAAEALARFDALAGGNEWKGDEPFANAASRSMERLTRCWAARDWEGILASLSPALRMDDRRRSMHLEIGFEDFVAQLRMLFDQPGSHRHEPLLATRGDRLSLHRTTFQAEVEGGGPLAIDDHLSLIEADADGRCIGVVAFDLDDIAAAFTELDTRFEAGEGAAHPAAVAWPRDLSAAFERRDWDAVAAVYSPSTVGYDHRLVGWGTLDGREAFLGSIRQMVELAPDARMRTDHARTSSRGMLAACLWTGTREGGAFESPFVLVVELDAHGKASRNDFYDPHHLDRALARFEEIRPR